MAGRDAAAVWRGSAARVVVSPSTDPERNFALERELMGREGDFVLLYINRECVVVGRNQSVEAEADAEWCAAQGVPVLRRVSGGGAVWHDPGNVNFAFVSSVGEAGETGGEREDERAAGGAVNGSVAPLDDRPTGAVVAALGLLGVEARVGNRGELTVGGRKVSGTASCVRGGRRLFHGTLLFDADLGRMARALAGDAARRGRRVASVPSATANLSELCPHLWGVYDKGQTGGANATTDRHAAAREFMERLARSLAQVLGAEPERGAATAKKR